MLEFKKDGIISNKPFENLPIGTILMYDGESWENDVTLPGWFMCDGSNQTPDLRKRFVTMDEEEKTGGKKIITLAEANMPSHYHNVSKVTMNTGNQNANHAHAVNLYHGVHYLSSSWKTGCTQTVAGSAGTAVTSNQQTNHGHSVTFPSKNTNSKGSGTGFDITPEYYSLIFIKKII